MVSLWGPTHTSCNHEVLWSILALGYQWPQLGRCEPFGAKGSRHYGPWSGGTQLCKASGGGHGPRGGSGLLGAPCLLGGQLKQEAYPTTCVAHEGNVDGKLRLHVPARCPVPALWGVAGNEHML